MKIQLWFKTTVGKWAASLTLLFIVLMSLKLLTLGISIKIPLPTPFIAGLGVIGFIMGIVSFVKNNEERGSREDYFFFATFQFTFCKFKSTRFLF
jgi:hypothetical protein